VVDEVFLEIFVPEEVVGQIQWSSQVWKKGQNPEKGKVLWQELKS
jgi:hypothetical protein